MMTIRNTLPPTINKICKFCAWLNLVYLVQREHEGLLIPLL